MSQVFHTKITRKKYSEHKPVLDYQVPIPSELTSCTPKKEPKTNILRKSFKPSLFFIDRWNSTEWNDPEKAVIESGKWGLARKGLKSTTKI